MFCIVKPWPNDCNIAIHHRSTLLNETCWTLLATMLHHVALCCIMLHYVALCCIMLHYVASCCIMLHHVALCCIMLHHVVLCWTKFGFRQTFHATSFNIFALARVASHLLGKRNGWFGLKFGIIIRPRPLIFTIRVCTAQHVAFVLATQYNIIEQSWIQQCWIMLHLFSKSLM